jgi:multiple sugar transport system permease protein
MNRSKYLPYLMVIPTFIFMLFVHFFPMVLGILSSFFKLNVMTIYRWVSAPFVGIANYVQVFTGEYFINFISSFYYTFLFVVLAQIICYILGMGAALLVNEVNYPGRSVVRGIFLFPFILPIVVGITNWRYMFSFEGGMINSLLMKIGIIDQPIVWLVGSNSFWTILITFIWLSWPFWFIVLLASLQTIPQVYFEAASLDGASPWQKFRHIIIPLTAPVTKVVWLLTFMWYFREFNVPYVMMGLSPSKPANLLALHIYSESFRLWNFSEGAVMAVLMSILLIGTLVIQQKIRNKNKDLLE